MKKERLLLLAMVFGLVLAVSIGSWSAVQGSGSTQVQTLQAEPGGVTISETYSTPRIRDEADRISTFANGINNVPELVYFTPQDLSTNTTILFLYNTGDSDADVQLEYYTSGGSMINGAQITLPPYHMGRICGDDINTTASSWQQNTFTLDFTSNCAYAVMLVPYTVKYSGYVAWNDSDYYDPMVPVVVLPLEYYSYPYLNNGAQ
jgi:hypothetical protein